jgi:D-sedoheptulose 7-phosphate isomerase
LKPSTSDDVSLYPLLHAEGTVLGTVLTDVERATAKTVRDTAAIREEALLRLSDRLLSCASAMAIRFGLGGRLVSFGNGGDAAAAQAVAQLFLEPPSGRAVPASSLSAESAVLTALGAEAAFDVVFAHQIAALSEPTDVALGLSTDGNSPNLFRGFEEASRRGLLTIGLAGNGGGKLAEAGAIDYLFVVDSRSLHRIQEAHTTLYHALWELSQAAMVRQTRRDRVG